MRIGSAAIGVPEYGRKDTCPDWKVCDPGCESGCETSVSCPENAFNTITSSAPLMEMRVRKMIGVWFALSAAAPEKLSMIFHPFTGNEGAGTKAGAGWWFILACR